MTLPVQILLTIFIALILISITVLPVFYSYVDWDLWVYIFIANVIIDILIALTLLFNLIWGWF